MHSLLSLHLLLVAHHLHRHRHCQCHRRRRHRRHRRHRHRRHRRHRRHCHRHRRHRRHRRQRLPVEALILKIRTLLLALPLALVLLIRMPTKITSLPSRCH